MHGLEGFCPKCRTQYCGWALDSQSSQFCRECGSPLEIRKNGLLIRGGFSLFEAGEYAGSSGKDGQEYLEDKNLLFFLYLLRN